MRSALYTTNTSNQILDAGAQIAPGTISRRFGSNINLNGNGITINGVGYYDIDAEFTIEGTEAGTAIISLYKDGVAIPGAATSATLAVGSVVTIGIVSIIKQTCCNEGSVITFVLSETGATITNASITAEKI